jgi:ATP-dependent Clp protease ATP-binding subunit ClpC
MTNDDRSTRRQFLIQSPVAALGGVAIPCLFAVSRASGAAAPDEQPVQDESVTFDRYTDRARKTVQLAYQEARLRCYKSVGTEHILLGLIKEGSGVAVLCLQNLGVNLRQMRWDVQGCLTAGADARVLGTLRQFKAVLEYSTPEVRCLFNSAVQEARNLQHNYVGTEHLLLALLLQRDGVAPALLSRRGLRHEVVQAEVRKLLGM